MLANNIMVHENISSHKNITRDFYLNLEKLIENNYIEEYINYKIGVLDFQTMIKKIKTSMDRNRVKNKDIEDKINYLIKHKYINIK